MRRFTRSVLIPVPALLALALSLPAVPLWAQDPNMPEIFRNYVDQAQAACETDSGTFTMDPSSYEVIDVTGDGGLDQVLDESGFSCSTGAQLYCGGEGCPVHFIINGIESALVLQDWQVVNAQGETYLQAPGDIGTLNFTWNTTDGRWDIKQQ